MTLITNWYVRIGNWGFKLFILNILWFVFTVTGLFILGLFPATTALFGVIRKEIMVADTKNVPIFKEFWKIYKREFLRSNLLGYMYTVVGFLLVIDIRVLHHLNDSLINHLMMIVTYVILLVYFLTLFYLFPVLVHFHLKTLDYIKYSLILTIAKPIQSLLLILTLIVSYYLFLKIPGLIPVIGVSILSYAIMKTTMRSFPETDNFPDVSEGHAKI